MIMTTTAFAEATINWSTGTVRATGIGMIPQGNKFYKTQARQTARGDAVRNLGELIKGIPIDGDSNIEHLMLVSDVVHSKINYNFLQYAKQVGEARFTNDTCEVTLEWNLFGKESVFSAMLPMFENKVKTPFPQPMNKSLKVNAKYTGLILDCRGLFLKPVMSPSILNDMGVNIYSYKNLDANTFVDKGVVTYTTNLKDVARAGNNPLIIKAVACSKNSNPIISVADSDKVLIANQATHFLDNASVVIIR